MINSRTWSKRITGPARFIRMGINRIKQAPTADELREKAMRYRAMMLIVSDQRIADALVTLAREYEALAAQIASESGGSQDEAAKDGSCQVEG